MVNHYTAAMAHRDSILGGVVFVGLNLNASGTLPLDIHFKASIASCQSSQHYIGADFVDRVPALLLNWNTLCGDAKLASTADVFPAWYSLLL